MHPQADFANHHYKKLTATLVCACVHVCTCVSFVACGFLLQGINLWQAFGWEAITTFMLVVTVYSVAVGEPSFGIVGPLAIGLVSAARCCALLCYAVGSLSLALWDPWRLACWVLCHGVLCHGVVCGTSER